MKRTISILLAALLLLFALPTVAEEETLQAGLYVSEAGTEYMYLSEGGVGVLSYSAGGQVFANGVLWTETYLEIERSAIAYALAEEVLSFPYDGLELQLHYMGQWEAFALGDGGEQTYAGAYRAQDGQEMILTEDGRGVYRDAAGEIAVFWGSLQPYWQGAEAGTCFILFDSYLSALYFREGEAVVSTETDGDVTFYPQTDAAPAAPAVELEAGLYVADNGTDLLYLFENGAGVFKCTMDGRLYANGVTWTEDGLTIERTETPFGFLDDVLCFTYGGAVRFLRCKGASARYVLGDRDTDFAGTYASEDGRELVLTADGQGVFTDDSGETPVVWGSYLCFFEGYEGVTEGNCYILFDSYLSNLTFEGDAVTMSTDDGEEILLRRQAAPAPAGEGELYYGIKMSSGDQTIDLIPFMTAMGLDPRGIYMELRPDGTGFIQIMDEDSSAEFTWTEGTITADGDTIAYTREGDHILLAIGEEAIEFAPAAEFEALMGGTAGAGEKGADALVGTWTFTKAKAMGMEIPASMMGTTMSIVLNEDGSAALISDGSSTAFAWTVGEDGTILLTVADTEVFRLSYDGAALTLLTGAEGVEMVFEKEN